MDSRSSEIAHDFSPLMKVFKDGRIERIGCDVVPPSFDPTTNVESKDIVISKNEDISARIFIPKPNNNIPNPNPNPNQKLPLLVYFHGGAFIIETPFSPFYHKFLNSLVSKANIIAVSVHYRKAPEHPLPIAYEDSWTSLKWVASHLTGNGPDEWLNCHADFGNLFFGGDSAGANIAHHMTLRVGSEGLGGINKIEGIILVHSYFWGLERVGSEGEKPEEHLAFIDKLWPFTCPTTTGLDDPLLNPAKDPNLGRLGCNRVLVCVAEHDLLKDRGWYYKEVLDKSSWNGAVQFVETKGEGHVFHLFNPDCHNAFTLLTQISSFINHTSTSN